MRLKFVHDDHGLEDSHKSMIWRKVEELDHGFFIVSLDMGETALDLSMRTQPALPCGLYGPEMGDDPIPETQVEYKSRNGRAWKDRLVKKPMRKTLTLTFIGTKALGDDGESDVLVFTAYGGPLAPQNWADPDCSDIGHSLNFWAPDAQGHALADPEPVTRWEALAESGRLTTQEITELWDEAIETIERRAKAKEESNT